MNEKIQKNSENCFEAISELKLIHRARTKIRADGRHEFKAILSDALSQHPERKRQNRSRREWNLSRE